MVKRNRSITKPKIKRMLKEGRGQNHGKKYRPWLTIQDVPSLGLSTRIKGWKTGRVHHFLSKLELYYFYILEWAKGVLDIREQYPLPLEETQEIANRLGIKHPSDPKTKENIVMTTDFLIDTIKNNKVEMKARSIKPSKELINKRIIEKQEIERTYWVEKGIDWGLVTEKEIPWTFANNVSIIHQAKDITAYKGINADMVLTVGSMLFDKINSNKPLAEAANDVDDSIGLKPGSSLSIFYHLIANGLWNIDMYQPIDPAKSIVVTKFT